MESKYIKISSLEEIVNYASQGITHDNFTINQTLSFSIPIDVIHKNPLDDVVNDAALWAAKERPKELHINHGEFIGDGLDHIINELTKKQTSNRALFSLLDQSKISNSGDNPIPSFMIMQCTIDKEKLYCTAYFRALEVTTFLRINIEEIRVKIKSIYDKLPKFNTVNLTIFAFRSYLNPKINTLKIPEIEGIKEARILRLLEKTPKKIAEMLDEKCKDSTVVMTTSIERIISSLEVLEASEVSFNYIKAIKLAKETLDIANNLREKRQQNSHHNDIEKLNESLNKKIKSLAETIRTCVKP